MLHFCRGGTNFKQQELYDNVLKSINSLYSNPKEGLTLVPGQAITLAAYQHRGLKTSAIAIIPESNTIAPAKIRRSCFFAFLNF